MEKQIQKVNKKKKTLIKLQSAWCQPLWLINCKATSLKPSSMLKQISTLTNGPTLTHY